MIKRIRLADHDDEPTPVNGKPKPSNGSDRPANDETKAVIVDQRTKIIIRAKGHPHNGKHGVLTGKTLFEAEDEKFQLEVEIKEGNDCIHVWVNKDGFERDETNRRFLRQNPKYFASIKTLPGRAHTYDPAKHLPLLAKGCADGLVGHELAAKLGIVEYTLNHWRKDFPEVEKCIVENRASACHRMEAALFHAAIGIEVETSKEKYFGDVLVEMEITHKKTVPDTKAAAMLLANWNPNWVTTSESLQITGKDGGPVKIAASNEPLIDLSQFSDEELEQFQALTAKATSNIKKVESKVLPNLPS